MLTTGSARGSSRVPRLPPARACACSTPWQRGRSRPPWRTVGEQPRFGASLYSGLRWRMLGPFRGGRVNAVSGVPGQPNTFYFGSVGGGVWKTTNAGRTWTPVFDSQPIGSIGAIGVAPSNPNVVYVGTGEADMRSQISYGNGMYKSIDGGKTWRHLGLDDTRQIGRVTRRPEERRHRLRRSARPRLRSERRPRRLPFDGRRGDVAEGPVQERERRRNRPRPRSARTRGSSTPHSGTLGGRRGPSTLLPTARAAASTNRSTAARRGSS